MKIADPESIKTGERELINSIMESLNSEIVESIAAGRLTLRNLEFRNGDMIIHDEKIVYKMEFETSVSVSVMFDRDGNVIGETEEKVSSLPDAADVEKDGYGENENGGGAEGFESLEETVINDEDDISIILEKNRNFWIEKVDENILLTETDKSDTDNLQEILKKNRDFWQKKTGDLVGQL